ncbi:MAG: serine protease, partial [Eubacterium sp.]|nr:serine protease [Eubacterium sp.]
MNNVLELKGKRFVQASRTSGGGGASMNSQKVVTNGQLLRLVDKIGQIREFWEQEKRPFEGILISVYYNKIVAKSNRIAGLFKGKDSNYAIVGAKFNKEKTKHIITYFLDIKDLDDSVELLLKTSDIMRTRFSEGIDKIAFDDNNTMDRIPFERFSITKSAFRQVVADVSYIEDFEVEMAVRQLGQSIVTLYNTRTDT